MTGSTWVPHMASRRILGAAAAAVASRRGASDAAMTIAEEAEREGAGGADLAAAAAASCRAASSQAGVSVPTKKAPPMMLPMVAGIQLEQIMVWSGMPLPSILANDNWNCASPAASARRPQHVSSSNRSPAATMWSYVSFGEKITAAATSWCSSCRTACLLVGPGGGGGGAATPTV
ncbi:hypothetical protein TSOC_002292 [Tetrabaena socialis]|uniref:Uncharacterized protein n=1 Tax=Tetrabaena socialis TaxID=47790 RepID=A0A2J8AEH9_9CHLO|nr:hypothetical protein TSOC_002292 [Tetrabaena socialis]|eukprot:PNH10906.1 hypothetical protein TSOC_002292 [Tetrabaena socialis]